MVGISDTVIKDNALKVHVTIKTLWKIQKHFDLHYSSIIIIIIAPDNAPYKMLHKLKIACYIRKNQLWTSVSSSVLQ